MCGNVHVRSPKKSSAKDFGGPVGSEMVKPVSNMQYEKTYSYLDTKDPVVYMYTNSFIGCVNFTS